MTEREVADLIEKVVRKYDRHPDWLIERRESARPRPTARDWRVLEAKFGCAFPATFVHFMNLMPNYDCAGHLDVVDHGAEGETVAKAYDHELSFGVWNPDLIPFHDVGNGDYHCLSAASGRTSAVFYVHHDVAPEGATEQVAGSFDEWLARIETFLGGELDGIEEAEIVKPALDRGTQGRLASIAAIYPHLFGRS